MSPLAKNEPKERTSKDTLPRNQILLIPVNPIKPITEQSKKCCRASSRSSSLLVKQIIFGGAFVT
jgi:hypothetical protein